MPRRSIYPLTTYPLALCTPSLRKGINGFRKSCPEQTSHWAHHQFAAVWCYVTTYMENGGRFPKSLERYPASYVTVDMKVRLQNSSGVYVPFLISKVAFLMSKHPRLGEQSLAKKIPTELMQTILLQF